MAPKIGYAKEMHVPTTIQLVHPQPCVADLIQLLGESMLDEVKVQQESKNFDGANDVIVEFIKCATISPLWCMKINSLMKWRKRMLWWFKIRLC